MTQACTWGATIHGLDCADCAATLAKDVEKLKGVKSASLNYATAKLEIEYDPQRFDQNEVVSEIRKLGYGIAQAKESNCMVVRIEGMDCADESTIIEKQLKRLPGVRDLRFNLVASEVQVDFDPGLIKPDQVVSAVNQTGMKGWLKSRERPPESYWEQHKRLILTVVSGVLMLGAFGLSWAGYPHRVTDPVYVLAMLTGGYFIARKGVAALRTLSLDMNFLMTIAVIGAAIIEEWIEGATVMFLFSVANLIQNYTMDRARNAIRALMDLSPPEVLVRRDGGEERAPVEEVRIGEKIIVKPGQRVGLDGRVIEGHSYVNQAPITGESMPIEKNPGDMVFAGTINQNGSIEVEVTHAYKDTTLSRIIHMVEEAQAQKAPSQSFVERFARYYTPAVIGAAVLVALAPPLIFGYPFSEWFYRALVLLVIACPCALVISTPVSIVSGLTAAARKGILVKGGVYMEEAGSLRAIAFDKTGTLTRGITEVTDIIPLNNYSPNKILRLAAAIEQRSEHHLGKAIVAETARRHMEYPSVLDFQSITGKGARAKIDGQIFFIGSHRLCEELGKCNLQIDSIMLNLEKERKTAVILFSQEEALGVIAIADQVREESGSALSRLKAEGIERLVLLTGDNKGTAEAISRSLPIDETHAELMPEDKTAIIQNLMDRYVKVAMVGDGVNDAPSMAAATMGIAMGAIGTDTALETADIALMTDDLSKLPFLMLLSRKTLRVIKQNVAFSLLIKAVFVALAIPGLATLWMAVAADMGASILVILNGLTVLATRET